MRWALACLSEHESVLPGLYRPGSGLFRQHEVRISALPHGFRRQLAEGLLVLACEMAEVIETVGERSIADVDIRVRQERFPYAFELMTKNEFSRRGVQVGSKTGLKGAPSGSGNTKQIAY